MDPNQVDERLKELEKEAQTHKEVLQTIKNEVACLTAYKRVEARMKKKPQSRSPGVK